MRDPLIGVERLYHVHKSKCSTTSIGKYHSRFKCRFSARCQIMTNNNPFQLSHRGGPFHQLLRSRFHTRTLFLWIILYSLTDVSSHFLISVLRHYLSIQWHKGPRVFTYHCFPSPIIFFRRRFDAKKEKTPSITLQIFRKHFVSES